MAQQKDSAKLIDLPENTHEWLPLQENMEGPECSGGELEQGANNATTGAPNLAMETTTAGFSEQPLCSPECVMVKVVPDSSSSSSSKGPQGPSSSTSSADLIMLDPNAQSNGSTSAGAAGTAKNYQEDGANWEWVSATDKSNDSILSAAKGAANAVHAALTATSNIQDMETEHPEFPAEQAATLPGTSKSVHDAEGNSQAMEDPNVIMRPTGTIGGTVLDEYEDLSDSDSYCPDLWEDMMEESTLDPSPHAYYTPYRRYMVKILSPTARKFLCDHLNPEVDHLSRKGIQKDWHGLVECIGKDYEYVISLDRFKDPTMELLGDWQTEEGSTIARLLTHLTKMDRYDIIDDLSFMDMIKRSAQIYDTEREQQANEREERRRARIAKKRGLPSVGDVELGHLEEYHAFICYDDADREFIKEMIWECEVLKGQKICTRLHDLLVGQNEDHMTAEMIMKRCGRIIIVLSERFCYETSPMYQYAMSVSQAVSPGTPSRGTVIPVRLDDCEIPNSLMHITPVDFLRCRERMWLWRKVTATLTTSNDSIAMMERQRLRHVILYEDDRADLRAEMKAEGYKPPVFTPPPRKPYVPPKPKTRQELMMIGDPERAELRRPPYLKDPVLTIPQKIRRKFRRFFKLENAWDPEFRY